MFISEVIQTLARFVLTRSGVLLRITEVWAHGLLLEDQHLEVVTGFLALRENRALRVAVLVVLVF